MVVMCEALVRVSTIARVVPRQSARTSIICGGRALGGPQSSDGSEGGTPLALTPSAVVALNLYCAQAAELGTPHKFTIREGVIVTNTQRDRITQYLSDFWRKPIECPLLLDLKPHHGYASRILKDGFTAEQFAEWLAAGCSDVSEVSTDFNGRPNLILRAVSDHHAVVYDILVPIRSSAEGYVWVDDVIPKGLNGRQKKAASSAFP